MRRVNEGLWGDSQREGLCFPTRVRLFRISDYQSDQGFSFERSGDLRDPLTIALCRDPQSPATRPRHNHSCSTGRYVDRAAALSAPENEPSARPRDDLPLMPAERSLTRWTEMS